MKKTLIIIFICQIFSILSQEDLELPESLIMQKFSEFMTKYNKTYVDLGDLSTRYEVFKMNYLNLKYTQKKQKNSENSDINFETGVTKFFDYTETEFRGNFLNFNISISDIFESHIITHKVEKTIHFRDPNSTNYSNSTDSYNSTEEKKQHLKNKRFLEQNSEEENEIFLPKNFDWRELGAVTPVKEQGLCGCCWAFSTTGNLEGQFFIKHKILYNFSEQQILNCDTLNIGCKGGIMHKAFKYLINSPGLSLSSEFPYKKKKEECLEVKNPIAKIIDYDFAGTLNEDKIAEMLYKRGPLSAAMNADKLYFYKKGIMDFKQEECNNLAINHSVLIVGYGEEKNIKYWIVKNTWGVNWGEKGYFRIKRGSGVCGINQYIITANIE